MMRKARKQRAWDKPEIIAAIYRAGKTLVQLAREAGLEESSTRVALLRPHTAGERAIAEFLGVPADVLFAYRTAPSREVGSTPAKSGASRNDRTVSTGFEKLRAEG